jgi:hypothetical protein
VGGAKGLRKAWIFFKEGGAQRGGAMNREGQRKGGMFDGG